MIEFRKVTIGYADATEPTAAAEPILQDVDLRIPEGDLALVVGHTGTGKSTLLGAMNGLVPHFTGGWLTGEVLVAGRDTRSHRPRDLADVIGYVNQDPLRGFVTDRVEDEIAYGMEQLGLGPAAMRKRVEETSASPNCGGGGWPAFPVANSSGSRSRRCLRPNPGSWRWTSPRRRWIRRPPRMCSRRSPPWCTRWA